MEKVIRETGFEPILEKIFKHLDLVTLVSCLSVCKYWNGVVQNPSLLLKQLKFAKMPEDKFNKWKELAVNILDDVNLTHGLSRCIFWALNEHKSNGFLFPETAASALGLISLLKFIASYTEIDFSGEANNGSSSLHYAAQNGHLDTLKFLATLSKDLISGNKHQRTPIHFGAQSGSVEIMKYFHDMGCDLKIPDEKGYTPIQYAMKYDKLEVIKYFISLIGDVNQAMPNNNTRLDGAMLIHYAVADGSLKCVELLLANGSRLDVEKSDGLTPIHLACIKGDLEVLQYFATHMENENAPIDNNGWEPFHHAANHGTTPYKCAASKGYLHVMKFLEQFKVDVNHTDVYGNAPIHFAASSGHLEVVKHLVPQLKHKNQTNQNGCTPFHLAAMNGHHKIVEYLSDFVDDIDEPTFNAQKLTALHLAYHNKHSETVKVLLVKLREKTKPTSSHIIHT